MKKLIIFGMLMLTTLFGQIKELTDENFEKATKRGMVVVEFYAEWNKANIVTLLDEWDNFEVNRVYRLNVEVYDKIMTSENIVVLPTIIFYLDGDEAGRLQGNMKFQLETTTKEISASFNMEGHELKINTINLNQHWKEIEIKLLEMSLLNILETIAIFIYLNSP